MYRSRRGTSLLATTGPIMIRFDFKTFTEKISNRSPEQLCTPISWIETCILGQLPTFQDNGQQIS